MPNRVPVLQTIARTYRFAFGNFLNNFSAAWMPLAIMMLGSYFLTPLYADALRDFASASGDTGAAEQHNLQAFAAAAPYLLASYVLTVACITSLCATLTREALAPSGGRAFLKFPFGAPSGG